MQDTQTPNPLCCTDSAPSGCWLLPNHNIVLKVYRFPTKLFIKQTATEISKVITNRTFRVSWTNRSVFVQMCGNWCDLLRLYLYTYIIISTDCAVEQDIFYILMYFYTKELVTFHLHQRESMILVLRIIQSFLEVLSGYFYFMTL